MNFENILETKKLKNNLDRVYSSLKDRIRNCEKQGMKISKEVKLELKNMVYSIETYSGYKMLEGKELDIVRFVPDTKQKYYKIDESLYIRLLRIISKRINNEEFSYMFEPSVFEGNSILECMLDIEQISKWIDENRIIILEKILKILEESNSKLKIQSAIMLLKNINKIDDYNLEKRIVHNLDEINNEDKLRQIYTILLNNRHKFSKNINLIINEFLDYIIMDIDENYDRNLNSIISKICDPETISLIEPLNNDIVDLIARTNRRRFNSDNMDLMINLLSKKFIMYNNPSIRKLVIDNTLSMDFESDLHEQLYVKIIEDIVFSNGSFGNLKLQQKIINKLSEIKYTTLLQLILDIYPIIDKYNRDEEKNEFIDSISNEKVKKITIKLTN